MSTGEDANRLTAEARARVLVDRQLTDAGWPVQDSRSLNLAVAFSGRLTDDAKTDLSEAEEMIGA